MANFRRVKPRTRTFPKRYDKWKAKRLMARPGGYYWWMGSWPAWWDIVFHRRRHRAETRVVERRLMSGDDPDAIVHPLAKRPHTYYW